MEKKLSIVIWLLNMEKREQERFRLKRLYLFQRLKNIFAIASDICFQRAIQFPISACLAGLSFITVSQWSFVVWNGSSVFLMCFLCISCLHSLHLSFMCSKCSELLHSYHIVRETLRTLLFPFFLSNFYYSC